MLLPLLATQGGADEPPNPAGPPQLNLNETQLTLRLGPTQGRATVLARSDQSLTIMTAAHFLSDEDVGKPILFERDGWFRGRLEAVSRNPSFQPIRSRRTDERLAFGTIGVDTSIAKIALDPHNGDQRRVLEKIRPAELTTHLVPAASGQVLTVHIIDQSGQEHVVRAGNHLNPRCLAWSRRSYDTQRGDSGAGVFVIRQTAEERAFPVLIGNVSQTDDRGGIASLASRDDRWLDRALNGSTREPK
jgi:hypothetical protein